MNSDNNHNNNEERSEVKRKIKLSDIDKSLVSDDSSKIKKHDTKESRKEEVKDSTTSKENGLKNNKTIDESKEINKNASHVKKEKLEIKSDFESEEKKKSVSKKVTLDELLKSEKEKEKEKEKRKKAKEEDKNSKDDKKSKEKNDVIINLDFKKEKEKANASSKKDKALTKEEKALKKKTNKDIKMLGGFRSEDDEDEEDLNEGFDKDVKEEINLDVLGVPRAKDVYQVNPAILKLFASILIIVLVAVGIMALPIFNVNDINITGLGMVEKEEVKSAIGYNSSHNFFLLFFSNPEKKLLEVPQIKNVIVRFNFPNGIDIKVEEIRLAGYIPYLSDYVYIDSDGRVVDISSKKLEDVPLIEGLNFSSFTLGSILETKNENSLKTIIEVTNVLNKYNITKQISSIDVTNIDDVVLYINNIEVGIGNIEKCDHKIRMAIEAIKKLSPDAKGHLNVSAANEKIYFIPVA